MNSVIRRGAQVGALSAGLLLAGGTAASAASFPLDEPAMGNVVGNGGTGGAGVYNGPGSVSLVNLGFGGRGGDGGTGNSSDGEGDVVGSGGAGGPGVYNAPGSYSLVNVSIDGAPGTSALQAGSISGSNFFPSSLPQVPTLLGR